MNYAVLYKPNNKICGYYPSKEEAKKGCFHWYQMGPLWKNPEDYIVVEVKTKLIPV